jgi:hypothetical protein
MSFAQRLKKQFEGEAQCQFGSLTDLIRECHLIQWGARARFIVIQGGEEEYRHGGWQNLHTTLNQVQAAVRGVRPDVTVLLLPPYLPEADAASQRSIEQFVRALEHPPQIRALRSNFHRLVGVKARPEGGPTTEGLRRLAQGIREWIEEIEQ